MLPDRQRRVLLSWSSGKDAAWALHLLRQQKETEVVGLLTTVSAESGRVPIHDVPQALVQAQARAAGLPLITVPLPWPCPNVAYEAALRAALAEARAAYRISHVAFGDLFLEDIRRYRETLLEGTDLSPLFPLWAMPTGALARQMIDGGLRARLTCVDTSRLPADFAGRPFDDALLRDLPPDIDPCGEAGEFHTFAYAGPMFTRSMAAITVGKPAVRDGFAFAEIQKVALLPLAGTPEAGTQEGSRQ